MQVGRDVVQIVKYLDGFVDVLRCCIIDHGSKLEPFSPPSFCRSGAGLQEYTYHYQKGYRQVTGRLYTLAQERRRVAA